MRRCVICTNSRDDVRLTQVVPGIWTDFNNWVGICDECHSSERYKKLLKQKKILTVSLAPPPPEAEVEVEPEPQAAAAE